MNYSVPYGIGVKKFHEVYGHPIVNVPRIPKEEHRQLRRDLLVEEFGEFLDAWKADDLPGMAKEAADLIYVIEGWALTYGVPLKAAFDEVQRSNMSKLGADGKPLYRSDGKVLKGPNYSEADIATVLRNHGWRP